MLIRSITGLSFLTAMKQKFLGTFLAISALSAGVVDGACKR